MVDEGQLRTTIRGGTASTRRYNSSYLNDTVHLSSSLGLTERYIGRYIRRRIFVSGVEYDGGSSFLLGGRRPISLPTKLHNIADNISLHH